MGQLLGKIEDEKGIYEFYASHFVLRCKCGSRDGCYVKSEDGFEHDEGVLHKFDCTFKHQRHLFEMMLKMASDKDLIIVCKGCKTEFPFNSKSYETLEHRAMKEKLSKT